MKQADLFAPAIIQHPYQDVADRLWSLARRGVYFGSSSWKYESWQGAIYVEDYKSRKDFDQNCLVEYSKIFPAVGGDFSFYNWPGADMVARLNAQTPDGFKVGLKCTEFITLKRYPNIPRWGAQAGQENRDFLNPKLFKEKFLDAIAPLASSGKLSPIIMEFTAFPKGAFCDWTEFAARLEFFFDAVRSAPMVDGQSVEYGVEIRTKEFLHDDFFAALKAMGVAPILNSWTRMPPLDEQWKLFEKHDFPFVECRAVMRPGRTRDEAVELFEPYDRNKETVLPARRALQAMAQWAIERKRPAYLFINNHLEGCAHQTIAEVTEIIR